MVQPAAPSVAAVPAPVPSPKPAAPAPPPPHYAVAPPSGGMPTWLLAILFAFAFVGVGAGVYFAVQYFKGGGAQAAPATAAAAQAPVPAGTSPMQKYVEVAGIRFVESPKHELEARFIVINHSDADIANLGGTVNIFGRTAKADEEAAGTFPIKVPSLLPNESKEVTAPLTTRLKPYELPDWQNLDARVQITSPR